MHSTCTAQRQTLSGFRAVICLFFFLSINAGGWSKWEKQEMATRGAEEVVERSVCCWLQYIKEWHKKKTSVECMCAAFSFLSFLLLCLTPYERMWLVTDNIPWGWKGQWTFGICIIRSPLVSSLQLSGLCCERCLAFVSFHLALTLHSVFPFCMLLQFPNIYTWGGGGTCFYPRKYIYI